MSGNTEQNLKAAKPLFTPELQRDLDGAIGGAYGLPDGREFWMDTAAVRQVIALIRPIIEAAIASARGGQ